MFIADPLLIEKAQIALLSASGEGACIISGPLDRPYRPLKLAIFLGETGKRLAAQARADRRITMEGGAYRVLADLSAQLDRNDVLVVEAA